MATLRVAVTQAEPAWLDLPTTIKKTVSLIAEAAQGGAQLIAFPECWITGYPAWIWARPVDFALNTRYIMNSLAVNSPEMDQIKAAAKESNIAVVLGFSERTESHSLYISQAIISPLGELLMHRRKIKPTHMERTLFGDGSGGDLNNVVEVDFAGEIGKVKVGCLACWEHTQPLLKYNTYSQGEVVHVALWPPLDPHGGVEHPGLWSMSDEGCRNMSQTYAIEGGGFVLHCTGVFSEKGIKEMGTDGGVLFNVSGGGGSGVIGPDGRLMTKPLGKRDDEGIVYADLDLSKVVTNRSFLDIVGHYSRPDLLWLGYDSRTKPVRNGEQPNQTVVNGKA